MNKEKEIIDLGEWIVPTSWQDISLLKYQNIERFYNNKDEKFDLRQVLHIMCDKTEDEVNSLPLEALDIILDKLQFLQTPPVVGEPTNKIEISGETYIINTQNKLRTGEYIATDTILKDDRHNYAAILAILCRKPDEIYDSHFENEVIEERMKMFEEQPITKILQIINFFLLCCIVLNSPTQLSLKVEERIDQELENIQNLKKNGEVSALSTKLLTRKLRKLKKRIKSI